MSSVRRAIHQLPIQTERRRVPPRSLEGVRIGATADSVLANSAPTPYISLADAYKKLSAAVATQQFNQQVQAMDPNPSHVVRNALQLAAANAAKARGPIPPFGPPGTPVPAPPAGGVIPVGTNDHPPLNVPPGQLSTTPLPVTLPPLTLPPPSSTTPAGATAPPAAAASASPAASSMPKDLLTFAVLTSPAWLALLWIRTHRR